MPQIKFITQQRGLYKNRMGFRGNNRALVRFRILLLLPFFSRKHKQLPNKTANCGKSKETEGRNFVI